jgi:arylformamidase
MKVIDLSHLVNPGITVFPGTEPPVMEKANTIEKNGFAELKISMFTHTATHIDAPCHILNNTKSLDQFPADKFIGKGCVIDCRHLSGQEISLDFIKVHEQKIRDSEFLLIHSGWSAKWKTDAYLTDYPVLSQEAAELLTNFNLKGIGLDYISIDAVHDETLSNHHVVLRHDIIIIENLTNLHLLPENDFVFQCFPIKFEHADGSPVRAVGIIY